jgi:hypothetical protein
MNPINITRRHILKALLSAGLSGMKEEALEDSCRSLQPALLSSDFRQALRELSAESLLDSATSPVDRSISWGLTTAGEIQAKRL